MSDALKVNEIFFSIQGESSFSGLPFAFIRLSGCNLRCSYCDSTYSYEDGEELTIDTILERVSAYPTKNVEVTGGEPLLQKNTLILLNALIENGYTVLLETNGSVDVSGVNKDVVKIVDIKCPDSGAAYSFDFDNVTHLKKDDEVKFVLSSKEDYDYAKDMIKKYSLTDRCSVIMSGAFNKLELKDIAGWVMADGLQVRLSIQLHKHIFGDVRGV
jgi:7-carboxy-7-deazaguanine synthase